MPCSVLCLPTDATSSSDPLRASISVPVRIWVAPVSGTNAPDGDLTNTVPVTGVAFSLVPSTGAGGAAAAAVVNVWSAPSVIPALLNATNRTWYRPPGTRFARSADTKWMLESEPTVCGAVDWSYSVVEDPGPRSVRSSPYSKY